MLNLQEEVNRLLTKPRMYYNDLFPRNSVKGLYDLIRENIDSTMTMVEVGCFSGVSSELFALHCDEIYCVDRWIGYAEIDNERVLEAERRFDEMSRNHYNIFKVKASSEEASQICENKSVDGVYIDASHDYINKKKDIQLWLPKIKSGGFIAGHDIDCGRVRKAVTEILGRTYKKYEDESWLVKVR